MKINRITQILIFFSISGLSLIMITAAKVENVNTEKFPSEILDLRNWKLNVPEGIKTPGRSDEYKQPFLMHIGMINGFIPMLSEMA